MAQSQTETKQKRTRRPSGPKPVFVLYKEGDNGTEVLTVTRNAAKALETMDADRDIKYQKAMLD